MLTLNVAIKHQRMGLRKVNQSIISFTNDEESKCRKNKVFAHTITRGNMFSILLLENWMNNLFAPVNIHTTRSIQLGIVELNRTKTGWGLESWNSTTPQYMCVLPGPELL